MLRSCLLAILASIAVISCGSDSPDSGSNPRSETATAQTTQNVVDGAALVDATPTSTQLSGLVVPSHYQLSLTIIPDQPEFSGRVVIDVDITEAMRTIDLHGRDLKVSRALLRDQAGTEIVGRYTQISDDGAVQIVFQQDIVPQQAQLEIEYIAPFNRKLEGLYRVDEDGRSYAFTQMEPLSARLAFPGFDEPRFKTPYDVEITTRADYEAFSNGSEVGTTSLGNGLKRVRYATTEKLPTYLIAFAVGPLDVVVWEDVPATDVRDRPLPLRGLAAKGKGEQLEYALRHTAGILIELENYFDSAYPYDKLDIVAAPDFSYGAMENAGLIIYRERLLLMDENAPLAQRRAYASVHAHELAHQWFGNLVTMPWWDDLWLNEAFATWMGHRAVAAWNPDYLFDRELHKRGLGAMRTDGLRSTRQIRQAVYSSDDVLNAFDGITYSKGGAVLSMFETWLGEEAFRAGIRAHMRRFAHGNATVFDLIESLTSAAPDKPIDATFQSYLFQPGVPMINVALDCSGEQASVKLSQRRDVPLGSDAANVEPTLWKVPVCLSYGLDEQVREECLLLEQKEQTFELGSALSCPDWIMPNRNGAGYYRWSLQQEGWEGLQQANDKLAVREKISMADSLEAALRSGQIDSEIFLAAVPQLAAALERPVAVAPMAALRDILEFQLDPAERKSAQSQLAALFSQRLERLHGGYAESEDEARLLRRELVAFLALDLEDQASREELALAGRNYLGAGSDGEINRQAVDPELLETAVAVAAEQADAELFDLMLHHLANTSDTVVRRAILAGLGRVRDTTLLDRAIKLSLDEGLRVNEVPLLLGGAFTYHNRDRAWQWLQDNVEALVERSPDNYRGRLPRYGAYFCSSERAEQLNALIEPRLDQLPGAPRALAQTLETIAMCEQRKQRQAESARRHFAEHQSALLN